MGYCNLCPGINYIPRVVCLLGLFIIVLLFLWPCVWWLCNVQNIGCIWLAAAPCRTYQSKLFKSKVSSRFLTKTKIDPSRSPIIRAVVFPCSWLKIQQFFPINLQNVAIFLEAQPHVDPKKIFLRKWKCRRVQHDTTWYNWWKHLLNPMWTRAFEKLNQSNPKIWWLNQLESNRLMFQPQCLKSQHLRFKKYTFIYWNAILLIVTSNVWMIHICWYIYM